MSATSVARIELLNKSNYDTWELQMKAILVKNDLWEYTNGTIAKPESTGTNAAAISDWTKNDNKAMSDIILSIGPSELKQVKNCESSRAMWLKLQAIYQSSEPARKATLLKRLTLHRMADGSDVREHLCNFFDTVDKLADMNLDINPDLLTIMLLYSLPTNFENFRCAIESRDELPTPETLRIKIVEESDARKNDTNDVSSDALLAKKNVERFNQKERLDNTKHDDSGLSRKRNHFKLRCFKCKKQGHKPSKCRSGNKRQTTKYAEYA